MAQKDIALIGLAVMGQNLVLNLERNGYSVAVYNRTSRKTHEFLQGPAAGRNIAGAFSARELVSLLKKPRKVLIMVKAGQPVDGVLAELKGCMQSGDLLLDCGNSHFADTERRARELRSLGIRYLGVGVSGGEEGALHGPSIMPGGEPDAYREIEGILSAIAARADGEPCVTHIGKGGAGHFVKMVHNGIEYGDMQLIAEAYDLLRRGLRLPIDEIAGVFARWNRGVLQSYLIEITADLLGYVDTATGRHLVDLVLDEAGQKGTGRWTSQAALDLAVPVPTIDAAVAARALSAFRDERIAAAKLLNNREASPVDDEDGGLRKAVEDALYASKIASYAQGFALMRAADRTHGFGLRPEAIARIWRAGCIIRARFLDDVSAAYADDPELPNLLVAPFFRRELAGRQAAWRKTVQFAVSTGIPVPAMSASLAYFDAYRSERLPANLIQAQRDYFGAHTYRRVDREGVFHTQWKK